MAYKKRFLLATLTTVALLLSGCGTNAQQESNSEVDSSSQGSSEVSSTSSSESESQSSESSESSSSGEKTVSSISVKANTVPTSFYVGDTFSVEGGVLQINYSDNTRANVNMTLDMITNAPDMSVEHENYEVNVSYEGATTSYVINVVQSDTRVEVTIGVSYTYNGGEAQDMVDGVSFFVGKPYKFHYGFYPAAAKDSIGFRYEQVNGAESTNLGTEQPTEIGNYTYTVYIGDGDSDYKPVSVSYSYSIIPTVNENVLWNHDNNLALTSAVSTGEATLDGFNLKYKNAKEADSGLLTLVKQCAANTIPEQDDNYVEIASPTLLVGGLTVNFAGVNNYIHVYGSYDLEHYFLVDTLTPAKNTTTRAGDYFYFRLVATPLDHAEMVINSISFTYEVDGAFDTVAKLAEYSDRFNHVSSDENNAYFHKRDDMVYDERYSTESLGIRLKECSTRVDFGTTIKAEEIQYYQISFKYNATPDIVLQQSKTDTTPADYAPIYAKPVTGTTSVGKHLKDDNHRVVPGQTEWGTITFDLINFFSSSDPVDIDGMNVWISRYCAEGAAVFDDFRLVQKTNYPVPYALKSISVSGATTEYAIGQTFEFDGVVTAHYTDSSTKVIPNDDANLTISSPSMSSSGNKVVNISYIEDGVTKKTSYTITVTSTGNPKEEETMTIVDDTLDLADVSHRYQTTHSYDCGTVVNETSMVYHDSANAIRISNLTVDDDCYVTIKLPSTITADAITVSFFAKELPTTGIYCQLIDDANIAKDKDMQRALTAEGSSKTSVNTNQDATNHFVETEAGNGWSFYSYQFYSKNVTNGVNYLRISTTVKLAASVSFVIDGIQVY